MNRLVRILRSKPFIIAASVIVAYTLAGFFLAPYLVRHYVPKIVQEQLKKQAVIGEVRFNPYVFTFEVNDFRMDEPDGQPIVGFKRFFVDFELKSLFKWAWTFRQVSLEGPQVNAVIDPDGALNLAQLAPPATAPPPPAADKDKGLPRLIFEEIVVDQGQIDFTDRRHSTPAAITFKPFKLQMQNITTLPGQEGPEYHHGDNRRRGDLPLDRPRQSQPGGHEGNPRRRESPDRHPLGVCPGRREPRAAGR